MVDVVRTIMSYGPWGEQGLMVGVRGEIRFLLSIENEEGCDI